MFCACLPSGCFVLRVGVEQMTVSLNQVALWMRNDDRAYAFLRLNAVVERTGLPTSTDVYRRLPTVYLHFVLLVVFIIPLYKALNRQGLPRDYTRFGTISWPSEKCGIPHPMPVVP